MQSTQGQPIRVLLGDGQPLFRNAVSHALDGEADLSVVAEVLDGRNLLAEAERARPDVIVLNANLPGCDGIEATRRLLEEAHTCKVIVISESNDADTLERAVEAGASGYLNQESSLSDLIDATRAVCRGETMIPREMLGGLLSRLLKARHDKDEAIERVEQLSRQEQVVLDLLAQGHSNNGIAEHLTISPATARTHVQRILAKLGVHSRLEAAAYVRQNPVIQLSEDD